MKSQLADGETRDLAVAYVSRSGGQHPLCTLDWTVSFSELGGLGMQVATSLLHQHHYRDSKGSGLRTHEVIRMHLLCQGASTQPKMKMATG